MNEAFGIDFVVSGHPDGHKSLLKINKEKDVRHLLKVIAPYVENIPSMRYKIDLTANKSRAYTQEVCRDVKIVVSSSESNIKDTTEEINRIIGLKTAKFTDQAIADEIGRTY